MAEFVAADIIVILGISALLFLGLYGLIQLSKQWKKGVQDRIMTALKRRRNKKDNFRADNGYSWDYFITFKVYDEDDEVSDLQCEYNMRFVLYQLSAGGMEIRLFYSLTRKEVYCKIRCPLTRLQKHADLINYKLLLDPTNLKALCNKGREGQWEALKIPENTELTTLDPYHYIYMKYEFDSDKNRTSDEMNNLYMRYHKEQLSIENELEQSLSQDIANSNTKNPLNSSENANNEPAIALKGLNVPTLSTDSIKDPTALESTGGEELRLSELNIFRGVDRLKLIHLIITYHGPGGCHLDPYRLLKDECILAYSPLHDMVELRILESKWLTFFEWPWKQPVDDIKDYFGEKIGLYFNWLGMYTSWLIVAAIVGFFIWINVAAENNNPNAQAVPYFAGFMGLWSALFLENWKRQEKWTAMTWGMVGFEEEEQTRPQFKGETIKSAIDGRPTLYFSRLERTRRGFMSQTVIFGLILVVIAVVATIFAIRIGIQNAKFEIGGVGMASIVASLLLALQIQFLNGFFGEIAIKLNNYENHRTDTEYEDALIAKTFSFQFVNSFASLFYIAFVKPFLPSDPCTGSCMLELQTTLGTIFLTRLSTGNLTELGVPLVKSWLENRKREAQKKEMDQNTAAIANNNPHFNKGAEEKGVELHSIYGADTSNDDGRHDISEIERTFMMPTYDVMLGTFDDYAEMVIQFGYTTMFIAAFPLATVMSLVNNYVEIRIDAWKLCQLCRRPEPRSCEDIGTWYIILEATSMASIFINSALVAFTGDNCINYTWAIRVWIFILMATGLFCIRLFVGYLIPDEPAEVVIQLQRQEYLTGKIIDNIEDEDDTNIVKNIFVVPNYLVNRTDDDPL